MFLPLFINVKQQRTCDPCPSLDLNLHEKESDPDPVIDPDLDLTFFHLDWCLSFQEICNNVDKCPFLEGKCNQLFEEEVMFLVRLEGLAV